MSLLIPPRPDPAVIPMCVGPPCTRTVGGLDRALAWGRVSPALTAAQQATLEEMPTLGGPSLTGGAGSEQGGCPLPSWIVYQGLMLPRKNLAVVPQLPGVGGVAEDSRHG